MMNILVFGASGGTGKHIVEIALSKGFNVTAVTRNPKMYPIRNTNLKIVEADAMSSLTFEKEICGQDAVISCLGIPKIQTTSLYSVGMNNIISSMKKIGVKRLICISSGALEVPPGSSFIMIILLKYVLQKVYKPIYSDMKLMEKIVLESDLDWTIVRAPKLTDGKRTGKYKEITNLPLKGIPVISRADLADYMVKILNDNSRFKKRVDLAS